MVGTKDGLKAGNSGFYWAALLEKMMDMHLVVHWVLNLGEWKVAWKEVRLAELLD